MNIASLHSNVAVGVRVRALGLCGRREVQSRGRYNSPCVASANSREILDRSSDVHERVSSPPRVALTCRVAHIYFECSVIKTEKKVRESQMVTEQPSSKAYRNERSKWGGIECF